MFHRMNRPSLQFPLKILSVLVLHLLLTHSCRGQYQLIGRPQPIVATVGDDIILPCQLQPAEDVSALAVDWTRPDLDSINVYVRRAGQDITHVKHPSYKGRTSLSIDGLKQGNISLKLSKVKLSDGGKYRCFILQLDKQSFVELVVASDAVSSPVISLAGIDRVRGGVVLQCESKGWHPQPDVIWLDSEGNLLSAGPTETVKGPYDLYTVSSRVTVEKRQSNNFTCRVIQSKTNQIRETHIIVADDFFQIQSSSSSAIIRLAVILVVCIVVIVAVFFFVWKWRQNMIKTKRSCWDETEGGKNKNRTDYPDRQPLNVTTTLQDETQRREKAEREVQTLTEDLKKKNQELEKKQADTYRLLHEEKQIREEEVKNQLDLKQKQIETLQESEKQLKAQNEELQTKKPGLFSFKRPDGKNSTEVFVEFDPNGKYLRLTNKSKEDLKLEGWKLRVTVNDKNPIMYPFKKSFKLRPEKSVTIWSSGCGPHSPLPSELVWKDLQRWATLDKLLIELINCQEEIMKTTETQGASQHNVTNPAGKNSTEVFVEFDPDGEYLRLTNKSKEELQLEGWRLRVKLNDQNPIMFTFEESFTLRPEKSVTIWVSGCGSQLPPSDLVWKDLNRWAKEDKLLVELIKCHEEIVTTTETQGASQHNDTNPAYKNSTEVFVKIDPNGNVIRLTNKSKEELLLEGWKLRVKLNKMKPIMFTFEESIILRAGEYVNIWVSGSAVHSPPSNLVWKDLKRWAEGDKLLVHLIKCHEEIVKTTELEEKPEEGKQIKSDAKGVKNLEKQENNETQGARKHDDTNPAGKNSTERPEASQHNVTNPAGKNSTEVFMKIDPKRKYLRLTNKSKEYLKLEGWRLRVKLNDQNPIMFTFEESFTLRPEKSVTIWPSGTGFLSPGPSNLKWKDLKHWNKGDKLLVELINCHEEIVTTTETQHNDINPSGKNSTDVFLEFDPDGNYLRLTNKSKQDLKLEGWRLRVKLNDENPIMFTFEESITLRAEESVTIGVDDYGFHHPPSDLLWKDLKRWNKGDKLLVELINCHEEIVKTTETQGASQHNDTNPAGKNLTEVFVEIDQNGKCLRLTNKSKEELKLEGWTLRVKVNDKNPIMYTFKDSIILRAEEKVYIWVPGFVTHFPPYNLVWKELKRWAKGDKFLVELINCHEEIVKTTEVK